MEKPSSTLQILNFRIKNSTPEYLVQYDSQEPDWLPYQKLQGNKQIVATYNRINNISQLLIQTEEPVNKKPPEQKKIREVDHCENKCQPAQEANVCCPKKETKIPQEYYPFLKNEEIKMKVICLEYNS
jgi:hypothetical protein